MRLLLVVLRIQVSLKREFPSTGKNPVRDGLNNHFKVALHSIVYYINYMGVRRQTIAKFIFN